MCRMTKYILKNFNLNEDDLKHVPAIVAEIKQELDEGNYEDSFGNSVISDSTLAEVFDEKLFERMEKNA